MPTSERIRYRVVKENLFHPDIGYYTSYGIALRTSRKQLVVSDIALCRAQVWRLARRLEETQLPPRFFKRAVQLYCDRGYRLRKLWR